MRLISTRNLLQIDFKSDNYYRKKKKTHTHTQQNKTKQNKKKAKNKTGNSIRY